MKQSNYIGNSKLSKAKKIRQQKDKKEKIQSNVCINGSYTVSTWNITIVLLAYNEMLLWTNGMNVLVFVVFFFLIMDLRSFWYRFQKGWTNINTKHEQKTKITKSIEWFYFSCHYLSSFIHCLPTRFHTWTIHITTNHIKKKDDV